MDYWNDNESNEMNVMIIWTCDKCGFEREDYPGCNEGGSCHCGGNFFKTGESYDA
jgi:hypothetical protein